MENNGYAIAVKVLGWVIIGAGLLVGLFVALQYYDIGSFMSGLMFACIGLLILGLGEGLQLLHKVAEVRDATAQRNENASLAVREAYLQGIKTGAGTQREEEQ